ncbi:MAG: hypothetical protein IT518_06525 [Burkholderiales bacterium]|nr:hypothetical protein [Burkholderiales bacterium]
MSKRSHLLAAAAVTALVGAATLFSTAASAGGNVAWSVSIGGPGFAVSAGQPYYSAPYRPYYKPYHFRPAPAYRPYYYPPRRVVYAPPLVVAPAPYYPAYPVVPVPY